MKLQSVAIRNSLFAITFLLALPAFRAAAQSKPDSAAAAQASFAQPAIPARITQAIDETQLVRLKGNVHPLARPEFDHGSVADSTSVKRGLLLLQRSAEQESALRDLLDEQQIKDSPNFHRWLTPQQFGAQFGPADSDIQALTGWLARQGFHDVKVSPGRTTIEFSGNVAQVRSAFHTEVHTFLLQGRSYIANASEPQIPAALAPVISGIYGLHNFRPKSLLHRVKDFHKENSTVVGKTVTFGCGTNGATPCFGVAPADFAKIYNIPATVSGNLPGTGVTIAIVQDSNLNVSDVQQYRALFGLANNFGNSNIILNGPDPGVQDPTTISGDEAEADLDAELSGAIAPGATIKVVVSENSDSLGAPGIDLSAVYIIDNNIAPIMSESFGTCESPSNGVEPFYGQLWEQAASQGITVLVATGDNGSDVCDAFASTQQDFASSGLSISAIASTPFNVAVGGTDFAYGNSPSTYWGAGSTTEAALSYIPESTWNNGCAATATTGSLATCTAAIITQNTNNLDFADVEGGSGGQSSVTTNTRPSWQSGITPPADTLRDIPDISLYSAINSNSNTFIIMCEADAQSGNPCSIQSGQVPQITPVGGTSAAAPAFAGIMAMIVQQQGGDPSGRQGNANHVLYNLYKKNIGSASKICASSAANVSAAGCIFYDVVTGNNSVACVGGSKNCSNTSTAANQYGVLVDPANTTTPAFAAVAGYDKATGLGSVNVSNLLTNWSSATLSADTVTVTSPQSGTTITHGNSASFTIKVLQNSGTTVPTGDVSLIATPAGGQPFAIGTFNNNINPASTFTLSGGSVTIQTNLLPGGADSIVAQYAGDGTFAPTQSTPPITVTVNKESSVTTISLLTFDSSNNLFDLPAPSTVVYGTTPYIMRVDVSNSGGLNSACTLATGVVPCPTGTITETFDSGKPLNDFPNTQTGVTTNAASLNSLGFVEDQPINLPGGSHTLVASYSGDNSFSASTSSSVSLTVSAAQTAASVAASPTTGVNTTTAVTLTALVATQSGGNGPTGTVTFSANGNTIGTAPVTPTNASGLNSASPVAAFGIATLTHTFANAATYTVSVSYATGDANYSASSSSGTANATVTVTQAQTGSFAVSYNPNPVVLSSSTGANVMSAVTVTPIGGFTGTVTVVCPTSLPPGISCTAPAPINITNANPVASNLTLAVTATSTTLSASTAPLERTTYAAALIPPGRGRGWLGLSAVTGLVTVILLVLPGRKRYRVALGLGLACLFSFTLGCGGGSGGGGGGAVATVTHVSVPAPGRVASGGMFTFTATVTGGTPTDQIQLFDSGVAIGTSVTVSGGTAMLTTPALSVGTHSISAHYLGDATNTQPSQSGTINVTVTGNTTVSITTNPAATPVAPALNVTVN
jgi:hypothetical protein